jgi:sporulation protein YlmC with PRC-barrel domain
VRGHNASSLLRAPVILRGIRLGEVEDVLLDAAEPRIIGLDVICGDGKNRFLPFSTARLTRGAVEIRSTLTLLDGRELQFYRANGRSLAAVPALAEAVVENGGALVVSLTSRC